MITASRVRDVLSYDKDAGEFVWAKPTTSRVSVGDKAGTLNGQGYIQIQLDGKCHRAHRLAWLFVHGKWPKLQIDHIDGDRTNNRISNLREVSNSENAQNKRTANTNNSTGAKGVSWNKKLGKWIAYICKDNKYHHLGVFFCLEKAKQARRTAELKFFTHTPHNQKATS